MPEPKITVNGVPLTEAQAMAMRVAVAHFSMDLSANGLGEDETGKAIAAGYLARIVEVNKLMFDPAAGAQIIDKIQQEMAGLRFRIHNLEGHNQYFFRCESAWCHPADKEFENPALATFKQAIAQSAQGKETGKTQ